MESSRREFVRLLVYASAGAAVTGCGMDEGSGGTPSCADFGARASAIAGNHGHVLAVPKADFVAPATHTYSIMGTADHDHEITLTGTQLMDIAAGMSVQAVTTDGGTPAHSHSVTVVCGSGGGGGGGY